MRPNRQRAKHHLTVAKLAHIRSRTQSAPDRVPRLIIDANCTICGRVGAPSKPWSVPLAATLHAAKTGHVVILNGTADVPANDLRHRGTSPPGAV